MGSAATSLIFPGRVWGGNFRPNAQIWFGLIGYMISKIRVGLYIGLSGTQVAYWHAAGTIGRWTGVAVCHVLPSVDCSYNFLSISTQIRNSAVEEKRDVLS